MRSEDIEAIVYIMMFLLFLIVSIAVFVIALVRKADKNEPQLVIKPPFKPTAATVLSSTISSMGAAA